MNMETPAGMSVEDVKQMFEAHRAVFDESANVLPDPTFKAALAIISSYREGGKVLVFGNGGSFSDALHIEGELTNRFHRDHEGLPAICLGAGQASLTATANDYSYDDVFARLVRANGKKGDIALGLSTSGNSKNVVRGLDAARVAGLTTIAMTGQSGGDCAQHADILVNVPSSETPRIQEMHILCAHAICAMIEDALFPASN